jgi:two-component system, sensor histidine kinase LadS
VGRVLLRAILIFILILSSTISLQLFANDHFEKIEIDKQLPELKINSHLYTYRDQEREFVSPNEKLFSLMKRNTKNLISLPHTTGNLWLAFKIKNLKMRTIKNILLIDSVQTGLITIYMINKNGTIFNIVKTGSALPPNQRSENSHLAAADLRISPLQEVTIIMKRESSYMFNGNFYLQRPDIFKKTEQSEIIFLSIYFGATFALILYNLFVFFYTKNVLYLSYVEFTLTVFGLLLIMAGGYDLFFYNLIGINLTENITFFTAIMVLTAFNFCRVLFGREYLTPYCLKFFKPLWISSILSLIIHISPFWNDSVAVFFNYLYDAIIVIVILAIFNCSLYALKNGHPMAKLYLVSWTFILGSTITFFAIHAGLDTEIISPKFIILGGNFAEMLTIAFSFTYKINYLDKIENEARFYATEKEKYKTLLSMIIHDLSNHISNMYNYTSSLYRIAPKTEASESSMKAVNISYDNIIGIMESARNDEENHTIDNKFLVQDESEPVLAKLDLSRLDLSELITNSLSSFKDIIDSKGLKTEVTIGEDARFVLGEKVSLVNNIFNNFLSNAIKFSNKKGLIKITTLDIGMSRVAIKFQDFGAGIERSKIQDILNVKQVESNIGTSGETGFGNGLKIAQSFIELHKGFLEIKSETKEGNSGTTFTIVLPTPK